MDKMSAEHADLALCLNCKMEHCAYTAYWQQNNQSAIHI